MTTLLNSRYAGVYFKTNWKWIAGFYVFNITDWAMTQIAMRSGGFRETNDIWGYGVIGPFHAWMKWVVLPLVVIALASPLHPVISKAWVRCLVVLFFIVCCLNAFELWEYL